MSREIFDTNLLEGQWESTLDYDLAQEILGHTLTPMEWQSMKDDLDDIVYHTVMSYQR
jgi:hypothetical protein